MRTVQACQQHPLVVIHPNKAKSFPAATVQSWYTRCREKRETQSECSRNARRLHASKKKCRRWRSQGVMGVLHPTRRKNQGKNLGRHLKLSKRQRRLFERIRFQNADRLADYSDQSDAMINSVVSSYDTYLGGQCLSA